MGSVKPPELQRFRAVPQPFSRDIYGLQVDTLSFVPPLVVYNHPGTQE